MISLVKQLSKTSVKNCTPLVYSIIFLSFSPVFFYNLFKFLLFYKGKIVFLPKDLKHIVLFVSKGSKMIG